MLFFIGYTIGKKTGKYTKKINPIEKMSEQFFLSKKN